jgi:hypothetical protein
MRFFIVSLILSIQSIIHARVLFVNETQSFDTFSRPLGVHSVWDGTTDITSRNGYVRVCGTDTVRVAHNRWVLAEKIDATKWKRLPDNEVNLMVICALKGEAIRAQILERSQGKGADVAPGEKLQAHYTHVVDDESKPLTFGDPLGQKAGYYRIQTRHKGAKEAEVAYLNYYNPEHGVVVAHYNYGAVDTNPEDKRVGWSELAWQQYKQVTDKHHKGDVKNLRYIVRKNIANDETLYVLLQASILVLKKKYESVYATQNIEGKPKDLALETATITRATHPQLIDAILGTDNGQGAAFILKDHASAIGKYNINTVYIDRSGGQNNLILEIT